jgi:hypothetical protein
VISTGTTHEVRIDQDSGIVVKRYRSWARSEPVREWTALTLLARLAPGLAPAPIRADLSGDPPMLTMSWLPGTELGTAPVTPAHAGPSDRAFELAILTEHISAWSDAGLAAGEFLSLFDLTSAETARVHDFRCLAALFWLVMLRPGTTSSTRNPPGTQQRQAHRLLQLLS